MTQITKTIPEGAVDPMKRDWDSGRRQSVRHLLGSDACVADDSKVTDANLARSNPSCATVHKVQAILRGEA